MRKKKLEKKNEKVLRLNRFLARKDVLAGICILEDVSLFFIVQYLLNICLNLPLWFETQNPKVCFGLKNLFPVPERVESFKGFYLVLVGVMVVWNLITIYQIRTSHSEKNFNTNQKGSARWTTNREIKEQYRGIPDRDETFPGAGGTIISRIGKTLYIDDTLTNNLIIGITRSGKGEMFVIPSIDVYSRATEKTSMVITDPKMELYKTSKKTLEERGYLVYLLNLDDPLHSMGFNPLEQIKEEYLKKNYAEAELLAQAFSFSIFNPDSATNQDSFWQETAASLLTALILAHIQDCVKEDELTNERRFEAWQKKRAVYKKLTPKEQEEAKAMCERRKQLGDILLDPRVSAISLEEEFVYTKENEKKITMYSIINTFTELARQKDEERPDLSALDSYFAERPMLDRAKMKYAGTELAGDRTKGSIYSSMFVKLAIFTFENIAKMTAESSLKLEEVGFGDKPVAVFLGIPDYDSSPHFLATAFIRQLTFVLEKKATRYKTGKCKRKVRFILDEFGNLPAIQGMDKFITVCLGRNIAYDLYIQAYSQVEQLYGKAMDTIVGNCGNQIYILTNDDRTAENFSKNLGNETIIDIQRSGERLSSSKSVMESATEKPLLNMNELEELREGECVVKRVMKRRDLKGKRIRPTPIFNSEASGKRFLYRYEYLTDTFPNPGEIDLTEVNTEDRSWIDHRERVWNFKRSFVQMQMERLNANKVLKLKELYNKDIILSLLEKVLTTEELMKVDPELPVMKLLDLIQQANLKEEEKEQIISMIELSAT